MSPSKSKQILVTIISCIILQVHVVLPQPGSNNAHRVDKNKNVKVELIDKAQLIDDVPFTKEIFQVSFDIGLVNN